MHNKTDDIASTYLGKKVVGSDLYNPNLLVAVPRDENRTQYGIDTLNLPFGGWDVWHAYEFSALTERGLPVTRLLKLKYACANNYVVESKSLKLYLNSFNMTRLGKNIRECLQIAKDRIEKDLSEKLQTPVFVEFLDNTFNRMNIFLEFENILNCINENAMEIKHFKEAPKILHYEELQEEKTHYLMFDSLRSNCRVTHQPDFGDVFIYYKSRRHITEDSLVKYLCSFRSEYHFHEECCEMIYKRLSDLLQEKDELMVCALYTRRGGIDICPVRYSENCRYHGYESLIDLTKFARNGVKQ